MATFTRKQFLDLAFDFDDELAYPTGYEDCIVGLIVQSDKTAALLVDADKIVERLEADGMSYEEAWEYYSFNIEGAYVENGPAYLIDRVVDDD